MSARPRTNRRGASRVTAQILGGLVLAVAFFFVGWFVAIEARSFAPGIAGNASSTSANADASANGSVSASASSTPSATADPYVATYTTGAEVVIDGNTIDVALSTTTAEIDQGLQNRPTLDATDGMLFVFGTAKNYQFWMPNMSFPLDMIWIGSDMKVVAITRDAPPLPDPTQPVWYRPGTPAQYVLEVNADYAAEHGINVGDPVQFVGVE